MKNIEFFRSVSIGQYFDSKTIIQSLTPYTKYLGLFSLTTPALFSPSWLGVLWAFAGALFISFMAHIPPGFLFRGLKPAIPVLIITAILQVLFSWSTDTSVRILNIGPISITLMELRLAGMTTIRLIAMMIILGLFTSVITERETACGVEDFFAPLAKTGFPAHSLAMAIAIAFRFIPIITGELESIVKAQASRGGNFGIGRFNLIRTLKAYLPLFVPVLIRSLERAEKLAEAMECRGYTGRKRTRYAMFKMVKGEIAMRIGIILFGTVGIFAGYIFR